MIAASGDGAAPYCRGHISPADEGQLQADLTQELGGRHSELKIGPFYGELRNRGLEYGASFANVRELWQGAPGSGEAFGRVSTLGSDGEGDGNPYQTAILLDGCLHVFGAALAALDDPGRPGTFVPAAIHAVTLRRALPSQVWSHVRATATPDGRSVFADIRVLSDSGELLAEFDKLELRRTSALSPDQQTRSAAASRGGTAADQIFKSREHAIQQLRPLAKKDRVALLSRWLAAEIMDTMGQAGEGLNLDKLPPSTAFLEIGLDSLLVTELQRRIQEKLEFRFKPMQGLDYQSIESLAEYIHDEVLIGDLQAEAVKARN
jgi:acyl carrier protein